MPYTSYDDSGNIGYTQRQKITSNNTDMPGYGQSLLFRSLNGAGINTQQKVWIVVSMTVTFYKFDGEYIDPVLPLNKEELAKRRCKILPKDQLLY